MPPKEASGRRSTNKEKKKKKTKSHVTLIKALKLSASRERKLRSGCRHAYAESSAKLRKTDIINVRSDSAPVTIASLRDIRKEKLDFMLNVMKMEDLRILHVHRGCLDSILEMIGQRDVIAQSQDRHLAQIERTQRSVDKLLEKISELQRRINQHGILSRYESLRVPDPASAVDSRRSSPSAHRTKKGNQVGKRGFRSNFMTDEAHGSSSEIK